MSQTEETKDADDKKTADGAEANANAAESAAGKAGEKIPPPPAKKARATKPKAEKSAKPDASAAGDFKEPGSTLNPADPNAPNYAFQRDDAQADLGGNQSIDQGTTEQPRGADLNDIPIAGGKGEARNGLIWNTETGPAGMTITVTRGSEDGPTTTFEAHLPHGATEAQINTAKHNLQRRLNPA